MKIRIRWGAHGTEPSRESAPEPSPASEPAAPASVKKDDSIPTSATPAAVDAPLEPGIIEKLMIEAYGASNVGCVRTNNEDYFLVAPTVGLYVVADGMGGAQAGEHASKLAVETVYDQVEKLDLSHSNEETISDSLVDAFEEANRRVMDAASNDPSLEGMGTTMVSVMECGGDSLIVASVGDSRVFVFQDGKLNLVTEDQTWVNEVGRRLGIDEESLKTHPMRHVLTMAIGVSEQLRVHTYRLHPAPGTQILLCSDGLHGVAPENEIVEILASDDDLQAKCDRLIASARAHGGPDNVTAVLLRVV
ncbi:MAG TPA: PP2C family serine/threonine-protein phosphatase [Bryobacteraceae bacterium]|nr:PP2C family serine/threonine-protein phosphatase [Bryobacteraceae bacterium]